MRVDLKVPPPQFREPRDVYEAASRLDPFQVLTAEHALLRLELSRALDAAKADPQGAETRRAIDLLVSGLRRHQKREDQVMYPVCERLFGGKDGPASALRRDHAAIAQVFDDLTVDSKRSGPSPKASLEELHQRLEAHFVKEERVLFPLMTAHLEGREAADLARRLRSLDLT
jgi:iron-sulfur cluster repair protein YtfE (RIC family)